MITSKIPRSVLIQMEMTRYQTVAWTTTSLRKAFGTVLTATEPADPRSGPAAQPAAARTISQILADRQTNIPTAAAKALAAGAHGRKDMRPSQPKTACLFCKSEKSTGWMTAHSLLLLSHGKPSSRTDVSAASRKVTRHAHANNAAHAHIAASLITIAVCAQTGFRMSARLPKPRAASTLRPAETLVF